MEICCKFTTFFRKLAVFLQSNCRKIFVKDKEIYSKAWCDIVFEGRNKDYGAYVLRRDAGRRYAIAMRLLMGIILAFLAVAVGTGIFVYSQVKEAIAELDEMTQLQRLKPEENHEFKSVAQGRRGTLEMKPNASTARAEVVDDISVTLEYGLDGPETIHLKDDDLIIKDADSIHNKNLLDMPEEGVLLTPTEVVEEMPKFPGGVGALMKWLDAHIIYTPACVRAKVEGDLEVTFYVDKTGSVKDPTITKSLNHSLDQVALSAIKSMPKWQPGRSNGKVAVVQITLPIHFQLK